MRLRFLDAIRGLASVWVAAAHFYTSGALGPVFQAHVTGVAAWILANGGHIGVLVFFVLSGFVIAHTVVQRAVSGRFVLEFAVRRSLRLDPPYWAAIGLLIVLHAASNRLLTDRIAEVPSVRDVIINAMYLQPFLGHPILGVAWTLCLEVQFYAFFVLTLWLLGRRPAVLMFVTLWVVSVIAVFIPLRLPSALSFWWTFGAGALLRLAVLRRVPSWLERAPRVLVWLGSISYSLYLLHTIVGNPIENLGHRVTGDAILPAIGWALGAFTASIALAAMWRRWIELPGIRIAERVRNWSRTPTSALEPPTRLQEVHGSAATDVTSR